jgi:glycosyl transferase family 25
LPPAREVVDPFAGKETAGIGIYYLNLDRSVERRQHIESLVVPMPFPAHRVVGMDARELPDARLPEFVDVRAFKMFYGRSPQKGEIMCTHAHIRAWRAFLASSYAYALVFEDDALFDPKVLTSVIRALLKKPHLWDVCNLDTRKRSEKRFRLTLDTIDTGHTINVGHRFQGGIAYLLSRSAVKKLLARVQPLVMDVEKYYARAWELGIRYTAVFPHPVNLWPDPPINRDLPEPQFSEDLFVSRWRMMAHHVSRWKTGLMEILNAFWVYGSVKWQAFRS